MAEEANNTNDWAPLLDSLEKKRAAIHKMGGVEKLAKRGSEGRLDARQRIKGLLDPGSFRELGTFVGSVSRGGQPSIPADGLIGGIGQIDGRTVIVGSEDFTVMGGSIGLGTHAKRLRLAQLAAQERVPLVMPLTKLPISLRWLMRSTCRLFFSLTILGLWQAQRQNAREPCALRLECMRRKPKCAHPNSM